MARRSISPEGQYLSGVAKLTCQNGAESVVSLSEFRARGRTSEHDNSGTISANVTQQDTAGRIWTEHRTYLGALALRWLSGNRSEAEDAVADVICKASTTLASGRYTVQNERAWLTRMLHNRCMDLHRSQRFNFVRERTEARDADEVLALVADERSAETLLLNRELGDTIRQALDDLPDMLRGPTVMRLVREESYARIAVMFHISEVNARKRIQQGRELLRQRLVAYLAGGVRAARR